MCYIQGTLHYGLKLYASIDLALTAFCDADWAECPDDRRSTIGFTVFFGPNIICWSSKKQTTVSRSSTEVEYRSMAVTTAELTWIQNLLFKLGHQSSKIPAI
jgi:hypothetical protein